MKKYKLVFDEGKEPQIFFVNEYAEKDGFISFYDDAKGVNVTYNKKYLMKMVEVTK